MYNKYDVVYAKFPETEGSVQSGYRPGVIIQNNVGNKFSPTLIAIPFTTKIKNINQATHLVVKKDEKNGLKSDSMLLAEQIATIDKNSAKKIGCIADRKIQKDIFKCFVYSAAFGENDQDLTDLKIL